MGVYCASQDLKMLIPGKGSKMPASKSFKHWFIWSGLALAVPTTVWSQEVPVSPEFVRLESKGTAVLDNGPAALAPILNPSLEFHRQSLDNLTHLPRSAAARLATTLTFPNVRNNQVSSSNPNFFGFDGLDHRDQRLAGTEPFTNSQSILEPP